jgi:hypothetical protein
MLLAQETVLQRDQVSHHLQAMEQVMIDLNRTGWPTIQVSLYQWVNTLFAEEPQELAI